MLRRLSTALAATIIMAGVGYADPIEGDWKTEKGGTAGIATCGGSFCITVKTGPYKGQSIGKFKADGSNEYSGNITDPENNKTYAGKATLSGSSLKMSGCVFGGLFCRSQTWRKL